MAERRFNPLTGEWVIVSPGRVNRPWQGAQQAVVDSTQPWQADCYLCPRNTRSSGVTNPDYADVFVFDNDFPALDATAGETLDTPLFRRDVVHGRCRVICYSARHDATLATLSAPEIGRVVDVWAQESAALGADHPWVQIFENKGQMMGCSSEHPHGQIWATSVVPTLPLREDTSQRDYAAAHGGSLLLDYAQSEVQRAERVVFENAEWLAVVPFWAAWPFELLLLPRRRCSGFEDLSAPGREGLSQLLHRVLPAMDRLFGVSFPYSMGWHGRGRDQGRHWQLHAHVYPPLLRSATVRKFMVGFEMLAEAQRDLTPEAAATRLRSLL